MIKRITITIAAAALFAVPAQSASAMLQPDRPDAVGPTDAASGPAVEQGVSTSPGSSQPEAVESAPASAEQGISTAPGVAPATEPVTEPDDSGQEAQQEDPDADETDGQTCEQLTGRENIADAFAGVGLALGNALGPVLGSTLRSEGVLWQKEATQAAEEAEEKGCDADQEAPA